MTESLKLVGGECRDLQGCAVFLSYLNLTKKKGIKEDGMFQSHNIVMNLGLFYSPTYYDLSENLNKAQSFQVVELLLFILFIDL